MSQSVNRDEISEYIGQPCKSDEWFTVTQERIDMFADATLDHQFIHVDPERAKESPFGTTVAHGFLTLSLIPKLLEPIQLIPQDIIMGLNYGLNRVRFPHPVPVNSELRATLTLLKIDEKSPDRVLLTSEIVVEIKGIEKPALIAESLAMWVFA